MIDQKRLEVLAARVGAGGFVGAPATREEDRMMAQELVERRAAASAPIAVEVLQVGGAWRLFVGGLGVATWPSQAGHEAPREYAEEAARVIREALAEHERATKGDTGSSALKEARALADAIERIDAAVPGGAERLRKQSGCAAHALRTFAYWLEAAWIAEDRLREERRSLHFKTDDVGRLEELMDAATPMPWCHGPQADKDSSWLWEGTRHHAGDPDAPDTRFGTARTPDAVLIVAMREALPALIAEVKAARAGDPEDVCRGCGRAGVHAKGCPRLPRVNADGTVDQPCLACGTTPCTHPAYATSARQTNLAGPARAMAEAFGVHDAPAKTTAWTEEERAEMATQRERAAAFMKGPDGKPIQFVASRTIEHAPDCDSFDFDPEKQLGPDKPCNCAAKTSEVKSEPHECPNPRRLLGRPR